VDVKVDPSFIREQRERRAWSQEHLAEVSGLGLRTIQRIEKTGAASYESVRSLAAVLEVDVAHLRVVEIQTPAVVPAARAAIRWRPVLGIMAACATGGALFFATSSSADQVLMDVNLKLDSSEQTRALATKVVVEDGTLVDGVNDLRIGDMRFSIVPRVREGGAVLVEVRVYEGEEEVVVSEPNLVVMSGEEAGFVIYTPDSKTLRLAITAEINPTELPPTLRAR
jgi:transcriptional regulator with XRE-family HTH domain